MRVQSDASPSAQIDRLQSAVDEKADELGMPMEVKVDYPKKG